MTTYTDIQIDIESVLKEKAKKHYNKIPKFAINYLKKVIHQEDLNGILRRNKDVQGVEFMQRVVKDEFNITLETSGMENIPEDGRFVFASNHPLGGLDGICLSAVLGEHYDGKIKYLVNDILMHLKNLESIFVPVNKFGTQAKQSAIAINEAYESDNQVITFPAGLVSRKTDGTIKDLEWMKSFVAKAIEYKRDIIPVHFNAKNSNFFYNFANIRKSLGLKFNIELIYLPSEMFKSKNQTFHITFGEPIKWTSLDKSKSYNEWAKTIKDIVYDLPNKDL